MAKIPAKVKVGTLRELDALVGEHVTGESPEIYWEDAHAVLRFESEYEALEAMKNLRSHPTLPRVDWESMAVTRVKSYRPYSGELAASWTVIEKMAVSASPLHMRREKGIWHVAFGEDGESTARSAPVAIALAALRARGVEVDFDADTNH